MPTWFGETKDWLDRRFAEELSEFDRGAEYKTFLLQRVRFLYLASKSIENFITICKVSTVALEFRAMLILSGLERKADPAAMLGMVYSVAPDCKPFFSFEQVVSDAVEIKVLGKMQLLEAEMMGVIYTFLSEIDGRWFREIVDSMEREANLYWDKGILPYFMQYDMKPESSVEAGSPT
jgi:hypothetical protein